MKNLMTCITTLFILLGCQSTSPKTSNASHQVKTSQKPKQITVGKTITAYKIPYFNDHSVIYNPYDKKWHAYGIINPHNRFIHLTADKLTQTNWQRHKDFTFKNKDIWAPHIILHDKTFYMYYTAIGTPREIRLATSKDLFKWKHHPKPILALKNKHTDNQKNKDTMVFKHGNQWIMYYSMLKDDKHWVVGYSTSKDLLNWSGPKICFDEHTTEPNVESPFVVKRGKTYYLLLSARPWPSGAQEFFTSDNPYRWDAKNIVRSIDPWHAGEVIRDLDGKYYLTFSAGLRFDDFKLAPLNWNDGLDHKPSSIPIPSPLP